MDIFLPIAHMDINVFLVLALGWAVGVLSGLVGVGGGFLITPLLMFVGVPPIVAVATGAAQIVGTSASGSYAHWRLGNVDLRMAASLLLGSWTGGFLGVQLAKVLERSGHFGTLVTLLYVGLLGAVGASMLVESTRAAWRARARPKGAIPPEGERGIESGHWVRRLPLRVAFPVSGLEISVLVPVALGLVVGVLTSLMGVGGGFVMVPVMLYLLRMPTRVVVGTSLFQLLFTTTEVTVLQAGVNQAVDPFLAILLVLGSGLGTAWGTRLGTRLPGEQLRLILAVIVVAVAVKMLVGVLIAPADPYRLVIGA